MTDTLSATQDRDDGVGVGSRWQHVKRGTFYDVIGIAELQAACPQADHAELAIYRGEDGKLWARNTGEFADGRFTLTTPAPPMIAPGVEAEIAAAAKRICVVLWGRERPSWETPIWDQCNALARAALSVPTAPAQSDDWFAGIAEPGAMDAPMTAQSEDEPRQSDYPDNTYTPYGRRSVHNLAKLLDITEQKPTVVSVINRAYDEIVFQRALTTNIPTEAPAQSDDRVKALEEDAARWRALWSSDRIRMMGWAGFDTAEDGSVTLREGPGWHHMGLEVWDTHPAKGDDSDTHGRKMLLAYVDARVALAPVHTPDTAQGGGEGR